MNGQHLDDPRGGAPEAEEGLDPNAEPVEVHHGMCEGADQQFEDIIYRAPWSGGRPLIIGHPGVRKGHLHRRSLVSRPDFIADEYEMLNRNQHIVDQTDELWATPGGFSEELRSGTWATIRRAQKADKPIRIFWPDGSWTLEKDFDPQEYA